MGFSCRVVNTEKVQLLADRTREQRRGQGQGKEGLCMWCVHT